MAKLIHPPTIEPVSLEEAKLHLRVDGDEDNMNILGLITAARQHVELKTWRALITQTWSLSLDCWPTSAVELPNPPLQSVVSITYTDTNRTTHTLDPAVYDVDTINEPGRVALAHNQSWPSVSLYPLNPIIITYKAGYGDIAKDVPSQLRQAIKLMVGHWYENREAQDMPGGIDAIIRLNKVY